MGQMETFSFSNSHSPVLFTVCGNSQSPGTALVHFSSSRLGETSHKKAGVVAVFWFGFFFHLGRRNIES